MMYDVKQSWALGLALAASLCIVSCGGSSSGTVSTGTGSVLIKDATYDNLGTFKVTFSKGTLIGSGSTSNYTLFTSAVQIDLLTLSINSSFLSGGDIPEGSYSGLELVVSAISATNKSSTALTFDGAANLPTTVPMEFAETLTVASGTPVDILLDFDVRRSYTETGTTTFSMSPVVKPDPDPPAMELTGLSVVVQSKDSTANTVLVRTTTQPYRYMTLQIDNKVPFVVDYQTVYVGMSSVMGAIQVGSTFTIDEARYQNGKLQPFILIKGADNYPANFAIAGGNVTAVDTTNNEITVQLQFSDRDQTGGVITAMANSHQSMTVAYSDSQTNLLLTKYGTQSTTTGDNAVVGMSIGFGGTWNSTTSKFTPILGIIESDGDIQASIKTLPSNTSGTLWSIPLTNVYVQGNLVADRTIKFDTALGKMFRAGQPVTDLTKLSVGDSFKCRLLYNLVRSQYEVAKASVGGKRFGMPAPQLNTNSIVSTGDPITFTMDVTSSQSDVKTELKGNGSAPDFTLTVKLPYDAGMFTFNNSTKVGKDILLSSVGNLLGSLASTDQLYFEGYFDSTSDTFYVSEMFIGTGN